MFILYNNNTLINTSFNSKKRDIKVMEDYSLFANTLREICYFRYENPIIRRKVHFRSKGEIFDPDETLQINFLLFLWSNDSNIK